MNVQKTKQNQAAEVTKVLCWAQPAVGAAGLGTRKVDPFCYWEASMSCALSSLLGAPHRGPENLPRAL